MKVCPKCGKQYPDDANFCPLDAGRLVVDDQSGPQPTAEEAAPAPALVDGGRVMGGRFVLGDRIGGGLTGEVYRAVDQETGAACAVKLVDTSVFPSSLLMQRTERELRQLTRLDSAGIAKVYGHGRDRDTMWIATELVAEGRSLHDLVFDDGPMELGRASRIVLAIGQALADAAKVGVIHRDLAPKNVMLGRGDQVKIINFGVAVPTTDKVPGVAEFVAPEMVEGKPVDQRANIYSLGAMFYTLLTGRPPYMGEPDEVYEQHLSGTPEAPSAHVELPDVVDGVVLKALERSSSKRFMTLRQFLSAVEHLAQGNLDMVSPVVTQPLARAGKGKDKKRQLSSTMLGYGARTGEMAAISGVTGGAAGASGDGAGAGVDGAGAGGDDAGGDDARVGDAREQAAGAEPDPGTTQKLGSAGSAAPAGAAATPPAAETQVMGALSHGSQAAATTPMTSMPAVTTPMAAQQPAAQQPAAAPAARPAAQPGHVASRQPALHASAEPAQPDGLAASAQAAVAQVAAAQVAPARAATGGAGAAGEAIEATRRRKDKKGQFRETLWFKKGEIESASAAAGEKKAAEAAEHVPVEDRYEDDGSLTHGDREKFSLKTGGTESMPAFRNQQAGEDVSSKELIDEMKGGRGKIIALIVIGVLALIAIIVFAVSSSGHDEPDDGAKKESGAQPEAPAPTPAAPAPE